VNGSEAVATGLCVALALVAVLVAVDHRRHRAAHGRHRLIRRATSRRYAGRTGRRWPPRCTSRNTPNTLPERQS
jgi:hypothetical protein